jgi:FkbM family methyltransferase
MTPIVATEHQGAVFLLPTDADEKFFVNRNRKDLRLLGRAVTTLRAAGRLSGDTFVDVGAHIGTTTVSALAHHEFAGGVAVEPASDNVRLLRANLALNGLSERVTVVPVGVADAPGSAYFLPGDPGRSAAFWTKGQVTAEPAPGAVPLDVVTLDGLVDQGLVDPAAVGLLWLDCQKRELEALRAASRLLDERVPLVFALRHRDIVSEAAALTTLGSLYKSFVDLRRNARTEQGEDWAPVSETLAQLLERRAQKKGLTDVLVY